MKNLKKNVTVQNWGEKLTGPSRRCYTTMNASQSFEHKAKVL